MPTADQYHRAASQLRGLGARLVHDTLAVLAVTDPDRIAEGPIATQIRRALDAVRVDVARAQLELERLAGICDRRAAVCAQHTAEVLRHRRRSASTDGWTSPPEPPAHWVEP